MSRRVTVLVLNDQKGRLITGEYSGGMHIDLGFGDRYPIEVITVSPNGKLRHKWDELTNKEREKLIRAKICAWIVCMDDPETDGFSEGWYQDYIDASRPR
jgi:hypothetical protein